MSEMTATRTVRIFSLAAAAALWVLAAALLWRTQVPGDLGGPGYEPTDLFPPGVLDETADYTRVVRWLWIGSTLTELAVLGLLAWYGPRLAARLPGKPIHRGIQLLVLVLASVWLATLPFAVTAHWWRRRHDISRQGYLDWLTAPWLERLAVVGLLAFALVAAMLLAGRLGRRWWIAGGPALAALGAGVILLQPLVLAPRLEPLDNRRLTRDIQALARDLGVGAVDVEVKDASERTTRANAEVAGIGPTRRVILWDTLLDGRFTAAEVRFIAAHELAHVARRHLWKGVAWFALFALPGVFVLAAVTNRLGGMAQPGAVPLAALTVVVVELVLLPLTNVISRRYEAEADWVALQATRDPAAARGLERRFVVTNLADPEPPTWSYVLRSTHPSPVARIKMASAWIPRYPAAEPRAGS